MPFFSTISLRHSDRESLKELCSINYIDPDTDGIDEQDILVEVQVSEFEEELFSLNTPDEANANLIVICSWLRLVKKAVAGDRFYRFSSPQEDWDFLCGREGIALYRDGQVIDCIVLIMN